MCGGCVAVASQNTWAAEYKVVLSVQDEFYDSDKVTGTLQRFHTKFLRKALRTQLRTLEKELEKRHEAVEDATYRMHDIERRLRGELRGKVKAFRASGFTPSLFHFLPLYSHYLCRETTRLGATAG